MYRKIIGKLQPVLYKGIKWYYSKPRKLTKRGIKIHLNPTVFHPGFYLSTEIFLDFMLTFPIEEKSILELGTGNGFISLYLAKNKACQVSSSDINPKAIEGIKQSASENQVHINAILSDLFENIPKTKFDYILVNPPYYPKAINSNDEYAFFCGEDFEYFHRFFEQIKSYLELDSVVYMILSETAPIEKIKAIAYKYHVNFELVFKKRKMDEDFLIYQL